MRLRICTILLLGSLAASPASRAAAATAARPNIIPLALCAHLLAVAGNESERPATLGRRATAPLPRPAVVGATDARACRLLAEIRRLGAAAGSAGRGLLAARAREYAADRILSAVHLCLELGQTFLLSIFQPYWMRSLGLDAGSMGVIYGGPPDPRHRIGGHPGLARNLVFAVVRALCSLSAGAWVDRLGAIRLLALPSFAAAIGLGCLLRPEPVFAYVFFAGVGLAFGSSGAITTAAWAEMFGVEQIGTIRALSSSVAIFLTAAAPITFGLLLSRGLSPELMVLACALLMLGVAWPFSVAVRCAHRLHLQRQSGIEFPLP